MCATRFSREHCVRISASIRLRLAQQLGMSLVPVREALCKLEAEGFVRIMPIAECMSVPFPERKWKMFSGAARLAIEAMGHQNECYAHYR